MILVVTCNTNPSILSISSSSSSLSIPSAASGDIHCNFVAGVVGVVTVALSCVDVISVAVEGRSFRAAFVLPEKLTLLLRRDELLL